MNDTQQSITWNDIKEYNRISKQLFEGKKAQNDD